MNSPLFSDRKHRPGEADLREALGPVARLWTDFMAHAAASATGLQMSWKHYAGPSGWQFVLRDSRRNIAYLSPGLRFFRASFAFGDEAVDAAIQAKLPRKVLDPMLESKRYPEGRPARIEVKRSADLTTLKKMLAIKLAS